jgi:hypothetical protein
LRDSISFSSSLGISGKSPLLKINNTKIVNGSQVFET